MKLKEKLIGILLIILGALPFLLNIRSIEDIFLEYSFLMALKPGETLYQIIIILLGIWIILQKKKKPRKDD